MLDLRKATLIIGVLVLTVGCIFVYRYISAQKSTSLNVIQKGLDARYPSLDDITAEQLSQMLSAKKPVILIDTRTKQEYDVSHLPGAIWMPETTSYEQFIASLGAKLDQKHLVFYCSVGVRSSALAARMLPFQDAIDAASIHNLKGGIFLWHNQNKPLRRFDAHTNYVHPYSKLWSKLIDNKKLIRYSTTPPSQAHSNN